MARFYSFYGWILYHFVCVYTHITFSLSIPPLIDLVLCCIAQLHRHESVSSALLVLLGLCAKPCLTVCDPMDFSPPGSCAYGILQVRILQWVAISSSRGSSWPRDQTQVSYVSCLGRWILSLAPPGKRWWLSEPFLFSLGLSRKMWISLVVVYIKM